jgi:hypothetical protein
LSFFFFFPSRLRPPVVEYKPEVDFVEQPLKIQIGNYNVRPTPVLIMKPPTPFNMAVRVDLVEESTGRVLKEGLQAGQVRSLKYEKIEPIFSSFFSLFFFFPFICRSLTHFLPPFQQSGDFDDYLFRLEIEQIETHQSRTTNLALSLG